MAEYEYIQKLGEILYNGIDSDDRTGIGTKSLFGITLRFDLNDGFPLMTHKKMLFKSVVSELLWFLEGSTDERRLAELNYGLPRNELIGKKTIWTANADKQGKDLLYTNNDTKKLLGPIYGSQWRSFDSFNGVDQILLLIKGIKEDPYSRRHVLTAWNPNRIKEMALPPCHVMSIFNVKNDKLSCMLVQRSADYILGSPYNIASYALLTHILAKICGLHVGDLVYNIADAHIYKNHIEKAKTIIGKQLYNLPKLKIDDSLDLYKSIEDKKFPLDSIYKINVENYVSNEKIYFEMAV
jgi:thymidylate synthase